MKRLLLALTLSYSASQAFAQGAGAPPPVPAEAPKAPTHFTSTGEAIEIPDSGFTITPPMGWEVIRNGSGASLLLQAPKPEEVPGITTYQANIRVMMFDEPRPIDDSTKDEFSKIILEKNSAISNRVTNYSIRSAEKVKFASGIEAFLYYAEFTYDSTPTMQMHVLVSSGSKHFLMTYTDLAKVFEQENSPGLAVAYTSMQGIKLDSAPPERFTNLIFAGVGILVLLLLFLSIRIARGYSMKKLGERIENEDGGSDALDNSDDDDRQPVSAIADMEDGGTHYDDEYENEMPETREAPKPVTKAKPAPKAAAPAPTPKPTPVPKASPKPNPPPVVASKPAAEAPKAPVAPKPEPQKFEARTRKDTVIPQAAPQSEQPLSETPVSEATPLSGTWNLDERPAESQYDDEEEMSAVSEIKSKTVVTSATKAKHQKVRPTVRAPKEKEREPEADMSAVACLSEILPNTGDTKKKKKGFFSWGKKAKLEDDGNDMSSIADPDSEDGDDEDFGSRKSKKAKAKGVKSKESAPRAQTVVQAKSSSSAISQPVSQVSEIAGGGWNLDESRAHHDDEDDED